MAKDRFSSQKPINYHSGWKQTGSFIKPEVKVKKEYEYKTRRHHQVIVEMHQLYYSFLNDWESKFIIGVRDMPYKLTPKQVEILRKISQKYNYLIPAND